MATPSPTSSAQRPTTKDATLPAKATADKPAATFRFGSVSAAVFPKQVNLPSGKVMTVVDVSVRKSYRTAEGQWAHTHTLGADDLLPAAYALLKCADFIAEANGEEA